MPHEVVCPPFSIVASRGHSLRVRVLQLGVRRPSWAFPGRRPRPAAVTVLEGPQRRAARAGVQGVSSAAWPLTRLLCWAHVDWRARDQQPAQGRAPHKQEP